MNGVTIVEEHLCRQIDLSTLIMLGIIFTVLIFGPSLAAFLLLYKNNKTREMKKLVSFCSIGLAILYIICGWCLIDGYNTTHMEYTVIVDDSVGFNDFYEKYEIISVEGEQYRVIEK